VRRKRDKGRKRLDTNAEKDSRIIEPETVNIAVSQKAEVHTTRQERRRLLDLFQTSQDPSLKNEAQFEAFRRCRLLRMHSREALTYPVLVPCRICMMVFSFNRFRLAIAE